MDIIEIKQRTLRVRDELQELGIQFDGAVLFGSYAKGNFTPQSDVDIAIVSKHFGFNSLKEGALLNRIAYKVFPQAEILAIPLKEYLDTNSISPILHEIKKTGVFLF